MNTFKKPVLLILGVLLSISILWSFGKAMKKADDTEAGALYMWGENDYIDVSDTGKWGDERQEIYEDRAVNVLPAKEFTLIDATDRQVFAIDREGNLYSWGEDGYVFFYYSDKELYCLDSEQTKGTARI